MRPLLLALTLCLTTPLFAACPDYLDSSLRRLHSKETVNLCDSFAGKPLLIVNTASFCGFTSQFAGLEALQQRYADRGLVVVGFASNDFRQEANDEAETAKVCYKNYGVTFTMIAPSHVKGENANPVFQALNRATKAPNWNFNKYLVDADGQVIKRFGSNVSPDSAKLRNAIEDVL